MMEFITTYQIPLICGGLLIIMALIGYEAEQREAIKRGDKVKTKKKKEKKVAVEEFVVVPKTVENIEPPVKTENEIVNSVNQLPEENVTISEVVTPEGQIPVSYENTAVQEVVDNNQNIIFEESLQNFMEVGSEAQVTSTFGVNDISEFQVPQNTNVNIDNKTEDMEEWKL